MLLVCINTSYDEAVNNILPKVHGANRLGANSLLDIVVFGRACANRAAELMQKPGLYTECNKMN